MTKAEFPVRSIFRRIPSHRPMAWSDTDIHFEFQILSLTSYGILAITVSLDIILSLLFANKL